MLHFFTSTLPYIYTSFCVFVTVLCICDCMEIKDSNINVFIHRREDKLYVMVCMTRIHGMYVYRRHGAKGSYLTLVRVADRIL